MPNILCVCTANRCRSPMAMAILRHLLNHETPSQESHTWQVTSAGTWAVEGLPAMPNSITVMHEWGLDIRAHRARAIDHTLLCAQNLILVMEAGHREALSAEFPLLTPRIHLLSALAGPAFDIKDPVAGSIEDYRDTARLLSSLLSDGLSTIKEQATIVP